jgi:hypothetical protein
MVGVTASVTTQRVPTGSPWLSVDPASEADEKVRCSLRTSHEIRGMHGPSTPVNHLRACDSTLIAPPGNVKLSSTLSEDLRLGFCVSASVPPISLQIATGSARSVASTPVPTHTSFILVYRDDPELTPPLDSLHNGG